MTKEEAEHIVDALISAAELAYDKELEIGHPLTADQVRAKSIRDNLRGYVIDKMAYPMMLRPINQPRTINPIYRGSEVKPSYTTCDTEAVVL